MSGYLTRLAATAAGTLHALRPRIPSLFEPPSAEGMLGRDPGLEAVGASPPAEDFRPRKRDPGRATPASMPRAPSADDHSVSTISGSSAAAPRLKAKPDATTTVPDLSDLLGTDPAGARTGRLVLPESRWDPQATARMPDSGSTQSEPEASAEPRTAAPRPPAAPLQGSPESRRSDGPTAASVPDQPEPGPRAAVQPEHAPDTKADGHTEDAVQAATTPALPEKPALALPSSAPSPTPSFAERDPGTLAQPVSPRDSAIRPQAIRIVPAQAENDNRPRPAPPAAPEVHVTIGRLELRAEAPQAQGLARPETRSRVMGLAEYLRRRAGGGRS